MKIVEPSARVYFHIPIYPPDEHGDDRSYFLSQELFMEEVGRTCYKSERQATLDSAEALHGARNFITMLNKRGHHAMLEHCVTSVKFVCDRGITHELVRHRLVSYAQESTRYCNYSDEEKFDNQISVIKPSGLESQDAEKVWKQACLVAEEQYMNLIGMGVSPQIARSVLPTCLKTEIWATANLREWMHIFRLRCSPQAHPQIREIMLQALKVFKDKVPSMFGELWEQFKD